MIPDTANRNQWAIGLQQYTHDKYSRTDNNCRIRDIRDVWPSQINAAITHGLRNACLALDGFLAWLNRLGTLQTILHWRTCMTRMTTPGGADPIVNEVFLDLISPSLVFDPSFMLARLEDIGGIYTKLATCIYPSQSNGEKALYVEGL